MFIECKQKCHHTDMKKTGCYSKGVLPILHLMSCWIPRQSEMAHESLVHSNIWFLFWFLLIKSYRESTELERLSQLLLIAVSFY